MFKLLFKTIAVVALIAIFAGGLYLLVKRNDQPVEVFDTRTVIVDTIIKKAVATGSISPRREVTIKSRVSGVVEELFLQAGETVERNTLIAKIRVVPDAVTLNAAQARVETARIGANNARRERDRRKNLLDDNLISRDEYAKYQYEYDIKREEESSARSNLTLIREGGSGEAGTVSSEIRSTVNGTILEIPVREGETVTETNNFNAGTTIAAVADMTDMIFLGSVDESEVGRIEEGMALVVSIGAVEGETFDGELEFISPKGNRTDGTVQFQIRASIASDVQTTIRAGYSASADVVLDRRDDVLTLDEGALIFEDDKVYVIVVKGDQFDRREIEVGLSDGLRIEIVNGLAEGDVVRVP